MTFDISDKLFSILNKPSIVEGISGSLYIGARKAGSVDEDVVIIVPSIHDDIVNEGTAFINIFVQNISDGRPNLDRLQAIAKTVVTEFKTFESASEYWHFEIEDQSVYEGEDSHSYCNLRVYFIVENA